jgi:predicted dehydrogenase
MLTVGILHETLLRWTPPPVRVVANVHAFIPTRIDPESGVRRPVGTPDSVQILAVLANGARATYHFSAVTPFGQSMEIRLHGAEGVVVYDLTTDRIRGASKRQGHAPLRADELHDIPIPPHKEGGWRVEAEFVDAIRTGSPIVRTDFETGVAYMEFTEAVARSAQTGLAVNLPLEAGRDA